MQHHTHVVIIGLHDGKLAVAEVMGAGIIKVDYPATVDQARNIANHMVSIYGCTKIIDRTINKEDMG